MRAFFFGGAGLRRRLARRRLLLLALLDAALQGLHQVDDLGLLAVLGLLAERGRGVEGVALLELGLDERAELLLVVVGELAGVEVGGQGVDQLRGHVALLLADARHLVEHVEVGLAHLVVPEHRLQHQRLVLDPQHREPGLLPQRELHDGAAIGLLQRAAQQRVRLEGARVRLEVVGLVEADRVDLVGRHELHHVDLVVALGRERLQLLLGEHHGVRAVVVGLGDVLVGDDLAAHLALALVADAAAVLLVHLVQGHVVALGGAVDLHRDVDQPEADGALPDGSHGSK